MHLTKLQNMYYEFCSLQKHEATTTEGKMSVIRAYYQKFVFTLGTTSVACDAGNLETTNILYE